MIYKNSNCVRIDCQWGNLIECLSREYKPLSIIKGQSLIVIAKSKKPVDVQMEESKAKKVR